MKFDKVGKIEILTFLPISCDLQLDKVGAVINQHRGTVESGNSELFKTCYFHTISCIDRKFDDTLMTES